MEITINSEVKKFDDQMTVEQLLLHQYTQLPNGIAVAVDNEVISRNSWNTFQLKDGNKILIIKATQGG